MKKFLSMMLIATMVIAMIPYSAIAETETTVIDIVDGPGYVAGANNTAVVVTPEITVVSGPQPAGYKYQWYIQANSGATRPEYILPWETGPSFTIHTQLSNGYYVNVEVTPLDSEGNAIGAPVKERYTAVSELRGKTTIPTVTTDQAEQYRNTPAEYLFEVDGKKFILLDVRYNGNYYVMTEEAVAKRAWDTRGSGKDFSATAPENLGYWLNNDFYNGDYLPKSIKDNITAEWWTTEGATDKWGPSGATYKIGLMSYSEYVAYMGRYGFWLSDYDATNPNGWEGFWLRTLRNQNQTYAVAKNGGYDNGTGILGTLGFYAYNTALHVRPTFRLEADFFETVKVNVDQTGEIVKQTIMNSCTPEQLSALYTEEEIGKLGSSATFPYTVKDMTIRDKNDGSTIVYFDLIRTGAEVDNEYVFIGAYKQEKLVAVQVAPVNIEKGKSEFISKSLGVIDGGYDDIRVFCFDPSIMKPASSAKTIADAQIYTEPGENDIYCGIVAPNTIYGVAGTEMNLYFENSIYTNDLKDYQVDVECSYGIQQQERWTCTPESAGTFTLTLKIYQNAVNLVTSKDITVKVVASEDKSVLIDGGNSLLNAAVSQRMTVVESNPDAIVLVVGNGETIQNIADRVATLKTANPGVEIGIVPPIAPVALTASKVSIINDIDEMVRADNTLFLIPAGWNVDGVYGCDENGIIDAGAQQAADVILAAVCDR